MKIILILGAGLSSTSMIRYFLDLAPEKNWKIRIGDLNVRSATQKIGGNPFGEAFSFDVYDDLSRIREIRQSDIVVSMLPAKMHYLVALTCIELGKDLVTASYVSPELKSLDSLAKEKNVILMNECGVDPGIDHMSAVQMIKKIRDAGGIITAFESSTGGLVAPGYENNPWQYKFTWNPRNVVLSGKDGARFLHNGKFKYIPYHKLFQRIETIQVPELGEFEVYGNRDSLTYRETYGLHDLQTMFRGTIRRPGFCEAWDIFVQLGATDDSYIMEETENMTNREFINSFMAYRVDIPVEQKLAAYLHFKEDSAMMDRLKWLGIFENRKIGIPNLTPAKVLQHILEQKWRLEPDDKDMIVMQHQFDFMLKGIHRKRYSTLVFVGEDSEHTAMSITVGYTVAIVTKILLEREIPHKGVLLPIIPEIYNPVLDELKKYGIAFIEEEITID
ncbi:MAG: saccharopine dehydrogenase NADP-binding domain-containing protein [Bacteroidales bacterium]|nr:saccharopine dehydrogenase NADP-binding domain-containing protein [Bacteroidales bacterium]MBN2698572.1 saccharopine dehydrogenase NADP-binding domain-containing protein [Bacteroidales bacterium]